MAAFPLYRLIILIKHTPNEMGKSSVYLINLYSLPGFRLTGPTIISTLLCRVLIFS